LFALTPDLIRVGDSILQFDWCVGELMKTLDRLGLAENTLIILCSDNGPVMDDGYQDQALEKLGSHRAAGPLRGGKYSVYEGGTRIPFITRWKGHIPPGVSEQVVCTIDLGASFAAMTGQMFPAESMRDSFNVLDAMLGTPGAKGRDHLIQQDNGKRGAYGFRVGDWKLVRNDSNKASNVVLEQKSATITVPQFQLFDLAKDPSESADVIKSHPEIAGQLQQRLAQGIKDGRSRPPTP